MERPIVIGINSHVGMVVLGIHYFQIEKKIPS